MSEVAQLEAQLEDCKVQIARMETAERLAKNADFRSLILNYFCVEEAARYARESGNPGLSKEDRENSLAIAQAAGHLKRFLQITCQMGQLAERNARDIENMLPEVRAEEGAE